MIHRLNVGDGTICVFFALNLDLISLVITFLFFIPARQSMDTIMSPFN